MLMNNDVDSTGLAYIAEGLQRNTTLLSLSLQTCNISITTNNGLLLARMLEVNSTMNKLDLCNNRISTEGSQALGEGLTVNRGLKTVYVPCLQSHQLINPISIDDVMMTSPGDSGSPSPPFLSLVARQISMI